MRIGKFVLLLLVTVSLIYTFDIHQPFGAPLPPIGKFMSPFTGYWQNAESTSPPSSYSMDLPGLQQPVQVVMDDRMVPHIFAENKYDVFRAQGYISAKLRLWQMDFSTRAISGRLSEVIGDRLLERDRLQRRKGMVKAAEQNLEAWSQANDEFAVVKAFTEGVNAYIEQLAPQDYPLEFKLLNYKPELWTPLKCALFYQSMAEALCFRHQDIEATNTRNILGQELFEFLYPEQNPKQSPIIPKSVAWNFDSLLVEQPQENSDQLSDIFNTPEIPLPSEFLGSNNWAVSPEKSATGKAIIACDPHLQLSLPSVWMETHLCTPEFNAYGAAFPSIPALMFGFNGYIAWGETNVGHDVLDWYTIDWVDDAKTKYRLDGTVRDVEYRIEKIIVRGKEPFVDSVKYTFWGPIVYESEDNEYKDLAMHWIANDKPQKQEKYDLSAFLDLLPAQNYEDYAKALQYFKSPAQNVAFACVDGDIAITVNGKLPLKAEQQGRFVQDGSQSANGWKGLIPWEQNPKVRNPERGFIASANQHSTDESYPYYYNGGFDDYRGRYINRKLEAADKMSIDAMKALQYDSYSIMAEEGLAALLNLINEEAVSSEAKQYLPALKEWNRRFEQEAQAPILYEEWFSNAYTATFEEILSLRDSVRVLTPETFQFITLLETHPEHILFDIKSTDQIETASDIVTETLNATVEELGSKLADKEYNWGKHRNTHINHLARVAALSSDLIKSDGYGQAPNAVKGGHGPSWRMIVEMDQPNKAYGIYPGGQSGNPGSPFYDNSIEAWSKGEYYELDYPNTPEALKEKTRFTINFNPGK